LAKKVDRTCLCITEQTGEKFVCHELSRLPAGLDYGAQARLIAQTYHEIVGHRFAAIHEAERHEKGSRPEYTSTLAELERAAAASVWVLIDAGGVGEPVVDGVREAAGIPDDHLMAFTVTGGTTHNLKPGQQSGTVSKSYLVSQLKRLVGFDPPLLELPETSEARALADELAVFEYGITDTAHPQWGARQGKHDDMIIALALSTLPGALKTHASGTLRYA